MRQSKVGELSEVQCVWLAACLDTDGYITLRRGCNNRPIPKHKVVYNPRSNFIISPFIGITNTDIRLCQQAQNFTHCGSIRPKWNRKNSLRPTFDWAVTGSLNVVPILEQVLPYLIVKKVKAQIVLAWAKGRKATGYNRGYTLKEIEIAFGLKGLPSVKQGGSYGKTS